jgi:hypothetical protein
MQREESAGDCESGIVRTRLVELSERELEGLDLLIGASRLAASALFCASCLTHFRYGSERPDFKEMEAEGGGIAFKRLQVPLARELIVEASASQHLGCATKTKAL